MLKVSIASEMYLSYHLSSPIAVIWIIAHFLYTKVQRSYLHLLRMCPNDILGMNTRNVYLQKIPKKYIDTS